MNITVVRYEYNNAEYVFDTRKVSKIQLPLYTEHFIQKFYTVNAKSVHLPIKLAFEGAKKDVLLRATLIVPDTCEEVSATASFPFGRVMAECIEKGISVMSHKTMKKYIQLLANSISQNITDNKLLSIGEPYKFPAFILKNGNVVGVGKEALFTETKNGKLRVCFKDMKGPYMSMNLKNTRIEIVIMDDSEPLITLRATADGISGYNLLATCELKPATESNVALCKDIMERYENAEDYFFERDGESI